MKKVSPFQIYEFLPKTNCGECGESTCVAFAVGLIALKRSIAACPYLTVEQRREIEELVGPSVRLVTVGLGDKAVKLGGEYVMHRHERRFFNKTALAIDVSDALPKLSLDQRLTKIKKLSFERVGEKLGVDLLAVRYASGMPENYVETIEYIVGEMDLPLILCSLDPDVTRLALPAVVDRKPLLYAATSENWTPMVELARNSDVPLALYAQSLGEMEELIQRAKGEGMDNLVIDLGIPALIDTVNHLVAMRRSAVEERGKLFGYPLMAVPAMVWQEDIPDPRKMFKESMVASVLMLRYASLLILHGVETWSILPVMALRQGIFSDPSVPTSVKPGLHTVGEPTPKSPVLLTTNFALTFYTVLGDVEGSKIDCYILAVDTGGLSVTTAVAGGRLTAEKVAELVKETKVKE
ncbi:MAG: acetyl-CoA decarbonylase/synthase complex subunit gamma, partial [Candidatus Bathyarchaeia archaeon]